MERDNYRKNERLEDRDPWTGTYLTPGSEDSIFFERISVIMKGYFDIEDAKSDPMYNETKNATAKIISGFDGNISYRKADVKFINDSLRTNIDEDELSDEIEEIRFEGRKKDIGKITSTWVTEWQKKDQKSVISDDHNIERKFFITKALKQAEIEHIVRSDTFKEKIIRKSFVLRIALPAAAAFIGGVILIYSHVSSGGRDRLFSKYYEPLNIVSPVTRSIDSRIVDTYILAISNYKNQNYQAASAGFAIVYQQDTLNIAPCFFMGITELALGHYDKTVNILENVIKRHDEYLKEASWYLGLAYLKTGNTQKSSECFRWLAQSRGYYSDHADKILRRIR